VFFIWVSTSGEALINTQSGEPSPTMMEDWVRGVALMVPARNPAQLVQLQFHCGKPPPAAEPKTCICITDQRSKAEVQTSALCRTLSGWKCTW